MVESRDIERFDINTSYNGSSLTLRLSIIRLWDDKSEESCSRFNLQLKIHNDRAESVINSDKLEGGTWTVIAHSDHNPNGGHDIRDSLDEKHLHIDVHSSIKSEGYNEVYHHLCNGHPPESNDAAIRTVRRYMEQNVDTILEDYLDGGR